MSLSPASFFKGHPTHFCNNPCSPFHDDPWDPFRRFHFGPPAPPPVFFPPPPAFSHPPVAFSHPPAPAFSHHMAPVMSSQVEWKETPEAHEFRAHLPGLKKEEVKVDVKDRVLRISGERKIEKEEKKDSWHHKELSSGKFFRSFWLPENAKPEKMKVCMENGELTVTVPKDRFNHSHAKTIEIHTR